MLSNSSSLYKINAISPNFEFMFSAVSVSMCAVFQHADKVNKQSGKYMSVSGKGFVLYNKQPEHCMGVRALLLLY